MEIWFYIMASTALTLCCIALSFVIYELVKGYRKEYKEYKESKK